MCLLVLRSLPALAAAGGKHFASSKPTAPKLVRKLSHAVRTPGVDDPSKLVSDSEFRVLDDKVVYKGWRSVRRKQIQHPDGQVHSFDVMTTDAASVFVFPWDTRTRTTTLLREFHPGVERVRHGVVAGMFEPNKHADPLTCAKFELEEEAGVASSRWVPLLRNSTSFDKYSDALLVPFLALDCSPVENPRPQDTEEYIEVLQRVTHKQVMDLIHRGEMNVPSSFTCMLAFEQLRRMNLPLE